MKIYEDFLEAIQEKSLVIKAINTDKIPIAHGTTTASLKYNGGVLIGADTRSTAGIRIVDEHKKKVHKIDKYTAAAFAGVAEMCDDYAGVLQVYFDNFRKVHRTSLDFPGKTNAISNILKQNLMMTANGIYAVPLIVGYDPAEKTSGIVTYDAIGGITEHQHYAAEGSGGLFATESLKKNWRQRGRENIDKETAIRTLIEAIYDSAGPQAGSSPPDLRRNILPNAIGIDANGAYEVTPEEVRKAVRQIEAEQGDL